MESKNLKNVKGLCKKINGLMKDSIGKVKDLINKNVDVFDADDETIKMLKEVDELFDTCINLTKDAGEIVVQQQEQLDRLETMLVDQTRILQRLENK